MMAGPFDFRGEAKIPLHAFLSGQCQGSGDRPEPVMLWTYVLYYQCNYCHARFKPAQVGWSGNPIAPAHEATPGRSS
jgi:hypothetical protein